MATTKSTVVGIRLDHERRAWVEAEAARLGVSVRGLFEGMIDEARSEETDSAAGPAAEPASVHVAMGGTPTEHVASSVGQGDSRTRAVQSGVNADTWSSRPASTAPSVPGLGLVTGIPGGLLRGAFSLTANLIESSGRCAANRLGNCALTRHRAERSL